MRHKLLLAAVAAAIVAVPSGVSAYVWLSNPQPNRLGVVIDTLGFLPVTPPTLLWNPGSIYLISRNTKSMSPICEPEPSRLEKVMRRSKSEARVSRELRKASFGVSAKLAELAQSSTEAEVLQSVSLDFDSVSVLEISLENLAQIAVELQERPICQTEILKYLAAGDYVCQVQTVLLASARYTLSRQAGAKGTSSIDTKALHETIKATLDPNAQVVGDMTVAGDGLHYGVKFTPRCFSLIGDPPPRVAFKWHERLRQYFGLFS
jgi:hypothetical protein